LITLPSGLITLPSGLITSMVRLIML
jgi:hypothetical protein